ncbi:MAG: glycerophosphodiester phosphodiesterase [Desulfobacterales bacterium]|nr:MAG: glycerophosphodiester phosphodiesterase [Desulfobacterales bacterium]
MWIKKGIKLIGISLLAITGFLFITMVIIDYKFSRINPNAIYSGCYKVWAHRGFFKEGLEENSIESMTKAFELGAAGTELDVFYDLHLDEYIVSHDFPYRLKQGRILKLQDVFEKVSQRGYFWLDFKNLQVLSKKDAQKATLRMLDLLEKFNLTDKAIIESMNPVNLSIISRSGLHTSYWITPEASAENNFFKFWRDIYRTKLFFLYGKFSALSMNHYRFSENIEKRFAHIPIHLFTVNDKKRVMRLVQKKNVRVILSDEKQFYSEKCKTAD